MDWQFNPNPITIQLIIELNYEIKLIYYLLQLQYSKGTHLLPIHNFVIKH